MKEKGPHPTQSENFSADGSNTARGAGKVANSSPKTEGAVAGQGGKSSNSPLHDTNTIGVWGTNPNEMSPNPRAHSHNQYENPKGPKRY